MSREPLEIILVYLFAAQCTFIVVVVINICAVYYYYVQIQHVFKIFGKILKLINSHLHIDQSNAFYILQYLKILTNIIVVFILNTLLFLFSLLGWHAGSAFWTRSAHSVTTVIKTVRSGILRAKVKFIIPQ